MPSTRAVDSAYHRLSRDLQRHVYPAGSRLPGERALSQSLGVSRATLRSALGALERQGLLVRSAQRGWFVARHVLGEASSTLQSFTEMATARGLEPSAKVLVHRVRTAGLDEAEALRIAPGSQVIELRRVRGLDGIPVCYDTVVLTHAKAPQLATLDMTDRSLYSELEEQAGVTIQRSSYRVQTVAADGDLARLLDVAVGTPLLVGSEVAYGADGMPVLLGVNHYRGDAYRFEADLYRTGPSTRAPGDQAP